MFITAKRFSGREIVTEKIVGCFMQLNRQTSANPMELVLIEHTKSIAVLNTFIFIKPWETQGQAFQIGQLVSEKDLVFAWLANL